MSPTAITIPPTGDEAGYPGARFSLALLNWNLPGRIHRDVGSKMDDHSGNFRRCRLGEDSADMIPIHHPEGDKISFQCDFRQVASHFRHSEAELAEPGLPLKVVDSEGQVVFETSIKVALAPSVRGFSPQVLLNRTVAPQSRQRVVLETEDLAVFELFLVEALVLGKTFEVHSDGSEAYFDFVGGELEYSE